MSAAYTKLYEMSEDRDVIAFQTVQETQAIQSGAEFIIARFLDLTVIIDANGRVVRKRDDVFDLIVGLTDDEWELINMCMRIIIAKSELTTRVTCPEAWIQARYNWVSDLDMIRAFG